VGQRMAIISAGVVMNVILGCICFIVAYKGGVKQGVAVIAAVEPGSPAWKNGSRTADLIEQIGETKNPTYEDFKFGVMLSSKGERLPITLAQPDRPPRQLSIEPRRNEHDATPVIGVYPAPELKLAPEREFKRAKMPVTTGPTAAARALPINSGDRIIATSSDPDKEQEITPMPPGPNGETNDFQELARRLERLVGKPFLMEVR